MEEIKTFPKISCIFASQTIVVVVIIPYDSCPSVVERVTRVHIYD